MFPPSIGARIRAPCLMKRDLRLGVGYPISGG